MPFFMGDQNQLGFKYESGTYTNASGGEQWIGQIQDHTLTEEENISSIRYLGIGTRNVDNFLLGNRDVKGKFSYYPQDWKMLGYALGSCVDGGSPSPYTHTIAEVESDDGWYGVSGTMNTFPSMTLVDSKSALGTGNNFIRTIKGAMIDKISISASQGEVVKVDVDYMGQSVDFSSGAKGSISIPTNDAFIYSDIRLSIPSGTTICEVKEATFSINNNMEAKHYLCGSREAKTIMPGKREYELSATLDMTSENGKTIYESYFKGGSLFNSIFEVTRTAGSRDAFFFLSGCRVTEMDLPSPTDGINEYKVKIVPKTCSVLVDDLTFKYNAW